MEDVALFIVVSRLVATHAASYPIVGLSSDDVRGNAMLVSW